MKAISISLHVQKLTLPINYNTMLQGLIYSLLSSNEQLSAAVHDQGIMVNNRKYKLFCFTRLKGKSQMDENRQITYTSDVSFEVRSAADVIIDTIAERLAENAIIRIGNNILKVASFTVFEKVILANSVNIRMIEPITVHSTLDDGSTYYYKPDEDAFYQQVADNAYRKYVAYAMNTEIAPITIYPIRVTPKNKVITRVKNLVVEAWHGTYHIEADPEIISFLYYAGLGDRNSQGFGVFEID
ncbi:MAG: CRISPR-associated endoribonuclease Cas6 [Solobacterium sp.]|nr:CRISPR-associated endoribonuclease Cas6 [Solobacterium sp.]